MKYTNANGVLPKDLIQQIQEYVQGEYIYIPVRDRHEKTPATDYKTELEKRNAHIYRKHLEGLDNRQLAGLYRLSESSIRRIIIKERKGYMQMNGKIKKVLFCWGRQDSEIKQIYDTAWQVGEDAVLKVYQKPEMLERNVKMLDILGKMDIPVGRVIPTQDNRQYVSEDGLFYFLSVKLPGSNIIRLDNIKDFSGSRNLFMMMGGIIARLHAAFRECEAMDTFWDNSLLDEMNGWVKKKFEDNGWERISKAAYENVVSRLADGYDRLPVQLIHRDVHFGNFLFEDGDFCGYIDFDLSQRNIRIFDLCYFLLGLLSEQEKLEITEEKWFGFLENVFAGYENVSKLSEAEKRAVPYVMECIELLFVSYFEGIHDTRCAEDAYKLFEFVRRQENRIWESIGYPAPC